MKKSSYLAMFMVLLIGLFAGYTLAAPNSNGVWHLLSDVSKDSAGTTSVDANGDGK